MRHYDLSPLYRSTIGFDRFFSLVDQLGSADTVPSGSSYPPYNIEKLSETGYRITLAVAGFAENELQIEVKENSLFVRGERKVEDTTEAREFLFQGIAARAFERRFQLADYVSATGARVENGLLHIDLIREIPEAKRPRVIPIGDKPTLRAVESSAA